LYIIQLRDSKDSKDSKDRTPFYRWLPRCRWLAATGRGAHSAGQDRLESGNLKESGIIEEVCHEMEGTCYQDLEKHDNR
jgi:hypothetical protein